MSGWHDFLNWQLVRWTILIFGLGAGVALAEQTGGDRPKMILIFVDDLGYADIGPFGSEVNRTPHLDRMAREGRRFTHFYSAASVCSPSRAALLTGCYPRRIDLHEGGHGAYVLLPLDRKGLNPEEVTLAEILRAQGYATACVGKWHLGDQPPFLPTRHGFETYFGIPYSNDMGRTPSMSDEDRTPPLPLMRDELVIEAPVRQHTITQRYTDEAVQFIREHADEPFFLYLPHTAVHLPLIGGDAFFGKSRNGLHGDAVEEVDASTGKILDTVRELGIAEETLVIFTSDNGASRLGSNAPFSGGKAGMMEGGLRVPCLMWAPGRIPAGTTCEELATTMDLLPTLARLAGGSEPTDRPIDGADIRPLMMSESGARTPPRAFYYYFMSQLRAVRSGPWKLHLALEAQLETWKGKPGGPVEQRLYHLLDDPGETQDLAEAHPEVVERLQALAEQARREIGDVGKPGVGFRPTRVVEAPEPLPVPESARQPVVDLDRPDRPNAVHPGRPR